MTDTRRPQNRWLKLAVAMFVTAAAIGAVVMLGKISAYVDQIARMNAVYLLPVLAMAILWQVLRTYRIGFLLDWRPGQVDLALYKVTSLHMFFSSVLPMRSGELALPYLLLRRYDVPVSRSTGILLVTRFYDLFALLLITAAVALWNPIAHAGLDGLFPVAVAVALGAMAGLFAGHVVARHLGRMALHAVRRFHRLHTLGGLILSCLDRGEHPGRFFRAALLSVAIWALIFISFYLSLLAITPDGSLTVAIVSGAASSLSVAQPVNGVAGLGVVQVAWAGTASWLGLEWSAAVASGILHHLVQIVAAAYNACLALSITFVRSALRPDAAAARLP